MEKLPPKKKVLTDEERARFRQIKAEIRARKEKELRNSLESAKGKKGELLRFTHSYYSKAVYLDMYYNLIKIIDVEDFMRRCEKDVWCAIEGISDEEGHRVIWKYGITVSDMLEFGDFTEVLVDRLERIGAAMPNIKSLPEIVSEYNSDASVINKELSPEEWVQAGKIAANELRRRQLSRMRSKSASRVSNRPNIYEESVLRSLGEVPRKSRTRQRSKSFGGTRRNRKRKASRKFSA